MKNVVRYSLLTFVLFLYMAAAFAQKGALHGTVSGLDAPLTGSYSDSRNQPCTDR
jgi:hypothetical protein